MYGNHLNRYLSFQLVTVLILVISGLMFVPNGAGASDLSGGVSKNKSSENTQSQSGDDLATGHRYVQGTVEGMNENTIKVNAGEVGDMTPRYLEVENTKGTESVAVGDTLQLEVNGQNQVVGFKKLESNSDDTSQIPQAIDAQPKDSSDPHGGR